MARGKGKKGGSGWTSLSAGKKAAGTGGMTPSKGQGGANPRKIHDTKGKNMHGRHGGQPKGK